MKPYPKVISEDSALLASVLRFIVRERENDVTANNNLPQVFISGRKVGKVPTASADVAVTDRAGDFNYDTDYIYLFTGAAWGRAALGTW